MSSETNLAFVNGINIITNFTKVDFYYIYKKSVPKKISMKSKKKIKENMTYIIYQNFLATAAFVSIRPESFYSSYTENCSRRCSIQQSGQPLALVL